jgi:hypothetical protein
MRIIGGHDYYDSALAYGQDSEVVFVREHREISDGDCPLYAGYPHTILKGNRWRNSCQLVLKNKDELELLPISIYVAGKHYGGIRVVKTNSNETLNVFWKYDDFVTWLAGFGREVAKSSKRSKWEKADIEKDVFPDLETFFIPKNATEQQLEWLIENRIVTAVWCERNNRGYYRRHPIMWFCNSAENGKSLRDYGFPKAVDPYTLFQEISMFVGGVLPRNPNTMIEITDNVVKLAKHGFDKWTFRRHKDDA